jgi:hypothetical protein
VYAARSASRGHSGVARRIRRTILRDRSRGGVGLCTTASEAPAGGRRINHQKRKALLSQDRKERYDLLLFAPAVSANEPAIPSPIARVLPGAAVLMRLPGDERG